jgi:hypothetical protein
VNADKFNFGTMATMASASTQKPITHADIMRMAEQVKAIDRPQEEKIQRMFKLAGFDVDAGDMLFLPTGTDISGVPVKYRDQVKVSRVINAPVFTKNPAALF